ncbi:MlaD family protein [Limisphaera sp. VF-2]|jgi:ABC-type transporter Mla subunit MlaD|uniref:MlaD family protein n=1 Tax=Limisphaera sp. VF-2 TaxID=3400418 RepID=UPI00176EFA21
MPLQDLTPELRTRLSRLERLAGWFVLLALALLMLGFGYYAYHTAQRKGWFVIKARYFTLLDRATGLRVGDPVKLMGFEVGRITRIEAQPPEDFYYNVYVEFEVRAPYHGYLWTTGSRVRVTPADLWGKRELEVTKGTGGTATYILHPLRDVPVAALTELPDPARWQLAEDIYAPDAPQILVHAQSPLSPEVIRTLQEIGRTRVRLLDTRETRRFFTGIWNDREGRFDPYTPQSKPYWLRAEETPALTERLDQLVRQVEAALPGLMALTNDVRATLAQATELTRNLDATLTALRPALTNFGELSAQLRGEGALGAWLLDPPARTNLGQILASAPATLQHATQLLARADQSVEQLTTELLSTLEHLGAITASLRQQVEANTNLLAHISDAIRHADEFVQGLKRHWLLRSAFRTRPSDTNAPPSAPAPRTAPIRAPRDSTR